MIAIAKQLLNPLPNSCVPPVKDPCFYKHSLTKMCCRIRGNRKAGKEAQLLSEHTQRSNSTQRQDRVVLERNCWSRSL